MLDIKILLDILIVHLIILIMNILWMELLLMNWLIAGARFGVARLVFLMSGGILLSVVLNLMKIRTVLKQSRVLVT